MTRQGGERGIFLRLLLKLFIYTTVPSIDSFIPYDVIGVFCIQQQPKTTNVEMMPTSEPDGRKSDKRPLRSHSGVLGPLRHPTSSFPCNKTRNEKIPFGFN